MCLFLSVFLLIAVHSHRSSIVASLPPRSKAPAQPSRAPWLSPRHLGEFIHTLSSIHFHPYTFIHPLSSIHIHSLTFTHSLPSTHFHSLTFIHSLSFTHFHPYTFIHSLSSIHFYSLTNFHSLVAALSHLTAATAGAVDEPAAVHITINLIAIAIYPIYIILLYILHCKNHPLLVQRPFLDEKKAAKCAAGVRGLRFPY